MKYLLTLFSFVYVSLLTTEEPVPVTPQESPSQSSFPASGTVEISPATGHVAPREKFIYLDDLSDQENTPENQPIRD